MSPSFSCGHELQLFRYLPSHAPYHHCTAELPYSFIPLVLRIAKSQRARTFTIAPLCNRSATQCGGACIPGAPCRRSRVGNTATRRRSVVPGTSGVQLANGRWRFAGARLQRARCFRPCEPTSATGENRFRHRAIFEASKNWRPKSARVAGRQRSARVACFSSSFLHQLPERFLLLGRAFSFTGA
jgi:hypothetical protein